MKSKKWLVVAGAAAYLGVVGFKTIDFEKIFGDNSEKTEWNVDELNAVQEEEEAEDNAILEQRKTNENIYYDKIGSIFESQGNFVGLGALNYSNSYFTEKVRSMKILTSDIPVVYCKRTLSLNCVYHGTVGIDSSGFLYKPITYANDSDTKGTLTVMVDRSKMMLLSILDPERDKEVFNLSYDKDLPYLPDNWFTIEDAKNMMGEISPNAANLMLKIAHNGVKEKIWSDRDGLESILDYILAGKRKELEELNIFKDINFEKHGEFMTFTPDEELKNDGLEQGQVDGDVRLEEEVTIVSYEDGGLE